MFFNLHPQTRVLSLNDSSVWLRNLSCCHQSGHFTELAYSPGERVNVLQFIIVKPIAIPLYSLLLHGVSAGPCFWGRAWRHKHARRHARPRDGLKPGPALTPHNNRLSNGRAMSLINFKKYSLVVGLVKK